MTEKYSSRERLQFPPAASQIGHKRGCSNADRYEEAVSRWNNFLHEEGDLLDQMRSIEQIILSIVISCKSLLGARVQITTNNYIYIIQRVHPPFYSFSPLFVIRIRIPLESATQDPACTHPTCIVPTPKTILLNTQVFGRQDFLRCSVSFFHLFEISFFCKTHRRIQMSDKLSFNLT